MNSKLVGWISVATASGGAILPFVLPLLVPDLQDFFWLNGPIVIWLFELLALVLGILKWHTVPGKIGLSLAIIISLLLLIYLTIGGVSFGTMGTQG